MTHTHRHTLKSVKFKESHKRKTDVEERDGNLRPVYVCSVLNDRRIFVCRNPQWVSKHKHYKCQAIRYENEHDDEKCGVDNGPKSQQSSKTELLDLMPRKNQVIAQVASQPKQENDLQGQQDAIEIAAAQQVLAKRIRPQHET